MLETPVLSLIIYANNIKYVVTQLIPFSTVVVTCGGTKSENCTYLVQSSVTSLTSPCTYSICPCNNNICRLRFDFTVSFKKQFMNYLQSLFLERCFIIRLINTYQYTPCLKYGFKTKDFNQ